MEKNKTAYEMPVSALIVFVVCCFAIGHAVIFFFQCRPYIQIVFLPQWEMMPA